MARNHVGYGKPYQPDEPVVAGKRISEKKIILILCNITCVHRLSQCNRANAFAFNNLLT